MPIMIEKGGDKPKSSLSTLAKNVLRTEFRTRDGMNSFAPKDDRFYDALASVIMWHSIMDANIRQVRFYVSNGYNTNIRIQKKEGQVYTLMGFVLNAEREVQRPDFRKGIKRIADYLEERLPMSSGIAPVFRVTPFEKSKVFRIHTHYQIGAYNCLIRLNGSEIMVAEFQWGYGANSLGK